MIIQPCLVNMQILAPRTTRCSPTIEVVGERKVLKCEYSNYTVAKRCDFDARVARRKYCSCHENMKFISLSQSVIFILLHGRGQQYFRLSFSLVP